MIGRVLATESQTNLPEQAECAPGSVLTSELCNGVHSGRASRHLAERVTGPSGVTCYPTYRPRPHPGRFGFRTPRTPLAERSGPPDRVVPCGRSPRGARGPAGRSPVPLRPGRRTGGGGSRARGRCAGRRKPCEPAAPLCPNALWPQRRVVVRHDREADAERVAVARGEVIAERMDLRELRPRPPCAAAARGRRSPPRTSRPARADATPPTEAGLSCRARLDVVSAPVRGINPCRAR